MIEFSKPTIEMRVRYGHYLIWYEDGQWRAKLEFHNLRTNDIKGGIDLSSTVKNCELDMIQRHREGSDITFDTPVTMLRTFLWACVPAKERLSILKKAKIVSDDFEGPVEWFVNLRDHSPAVMSELWELVAPYVPDGNLPPNPFLKPASEAEHSGGH